MAQGSRPPAVLCICNSRSGRRPTSTCLPPLQQLLDQRGISLQVIDLGPQFAERLTDAIVSRDWLAVAGIGGDGTQMACLNVIRRLQIATPGQRLPPYALIPFGTGNNLGKSLGLVPGIAALPRTVDVMLNGDTRAMDLGTWDEGWFCDGLTVGLDAEILARRDRLNARYANSGIHGYVFYGIGTLQALPGFRAPNATITVNGETWHRGPITNFVVNNCRIYGGEFALTPFAQVDDGQLDAICLSHPVTNLMGYLGAWRHLHLGDSTQRIRRGTSFTIELDRPVCIQVDGELFPPRDRLTIGIDAAAVAVKMPSDLPAAKPASPVAQESVRHVRS